LCIGAAIQLLWLPWSISVSADCVLTGRRGLAPKVVWMAAAVAAMPQLQSQWLAPSVRQMMIMMIR
jgi:hypothetical protein